MVVLTEGFADGGFLVSQAYGYRSRENGVIDNATGADVLYSAGLIVNQVSGGTAAAAHPTNTGNGTIGGVTPGAGSKFGTYILTAKTATDFGVVDPNGDPLPDATVGTAYVGPIDFTLAAGGTAFAAGDSFTVNVSEQTGGWVSWTGGTINRIGILFNRLVVAAGTFRKVTVVVRECEVNQAELQWDPTVTGSNNVAALQATAIAALNAAGIIPR